MDTHGGGNLRIRRGVRQNFGYVVAIDRDGEHVTYARLGSSPEHVFNPHAMTRVLQVIEMAMAVYEHGWCDRIHREARLPTWYA